jgi:hypothetical protein
MAMMVQCWKSQSVGVKNHSIGVENHNADDVGLLTRLGGTD